MKTKKIRKKLESKMGSDLNFTVIDYRPGHWINPLNNDWVTKRVYVSLMSEDTGKIKKLQLLIDKLNEKTLKENIEIIHEITI